METLLVRLKDTDAKHGYVLRRYTYAGIKFLPERGWYRVDTKVGEYLKAIRQVPGNEFTPLAFDVCTDTEARSLEDTEAEASKVRHAASEAVDATSARGPAATVDAPKSDSPDKNAKAKSDKK